jgi:DNA-binding beta-propeller fold protein YncE
MPLPLRAVLFVFVLPLGLAIGATAPAPAAPPDAGRLYRGTSGELTLELIVLDPRPDAERLLQISIDGKCSNDFRVKAAFVTSADDDGHFDLRERRELDAEHQKWRLRGAFQAHEVVSGKIDASLREENDEGPDFTCKLTDQRWRATGKRRRGLEVIQATVPIRPSRTANVVGTGVVTGPDAVYVTVSQLVDEQRRRVVRIDPRTNTVAWERTPDLDPAAIAAAADAVWLLGDLGHSSTLERLDPATGQPVARIPVGPYDFGGVAATEGAVWVSGTARAGSNAGTIQRVDPTTSTVTATIAVRGFEPTELATGPQGVYALGLRRGQGGVNAGGGVARIDPATVAVAASADIGVDQDITVSAEDVWAAGGGAEDVLRLDPVTLDVTGRISQDAFAIVAAPPGLWAVSDGLVAFDRMALAPAVRVPLVRTDAHLAGGFGSVWVLDIELGVVTRVRADLQPRPEDRKT